MWAIRLMRDYAYSHLKDLSREFTNPMWAIRLMRDYAYSQLNDLSREHINVIQKFLEAPWKAKGIQSSYIEKSCSLWHNG